MESPFTDDYEKRCQNDELNRKARQNLSYTIWPDQSLGKYVENKTGVKCVIMSPTSDGGMPHTRAPGIICLPAYFPTERLKTTLQHEIIHITQRKNLEETKEFLLKEGWVNIEDSEIPPELVRKCRLNPDTYYCRFFAWGGQYVPLPLFEREDKPVLREIQVRWWDLQNEKFVPIPSSYIKRYGEKNVSEMEHPFELFAYKYEKM